MEFIEYYIESEKSTCCVSVHTYIINPKNWLESFCIEAPCKREAICAFNTAERSSF